MDKTDKEKSTKFYCKCVSVLYLGPHVVIFRKNKDG